MNKKVSLQSKKAARSVTMFDLSDLKFRIPLFMSEAIICKQSSVKTLAVSAAPFRELLNFLVYGQHSELLNERARRQPVLSWEEIPLTTKELDVVLSSTLSILSGVTERFCQPLE